MNSLCSIFKCRLLLFYIVDKKIVAYAPMMLKTFTVMVSAHNYSENLVWTGSRSIDLSLQVETTVPMSLPIHQSRS